MTTILALKEFCSTFGLQLKTVGKSQDRNWYCLRAYDTKSLSGRTMMSLVPTLALTKPMTNSANATVGKVCSQTLSTGANHVSIARCTRPPKYKRKAPLLPIPVTSPFDRLSVDFLGSSPVTHSGNRSVVCFTDYLTKWPKVYAIPTAKAPVIVKLIATEILSRHGASRVLLSDRGKNFLSKLVMGVCRLINTKKVNTTAYQPQTNTRVNDSMEQLRTQFLCLSALSRKIGILPVCLSSDSI